MVRDISRLFSNCYEPVCSLSRMYFRTFETLKDNGIEDARTEATLMLQRFYPNAPAYKLGTDTRSQVPDSVQQGVIKMLEKRLEGYPLQYILGEWKFFDLDFYCGEGVLIPRYDTEVLVQTALDKLTEMESAPTVKVIDLCAGTGCVGIAINKNVPSARVTEVEISMRAGEYLEKNIALHGLDMNVLYGDVMNSYTVSVADNDVDLIVCNPPYITEEDMKTLQTEVTYEPEIALNGGEDGLDYYRQITALWKKKLKKGGFLMYELGIGQSEAVEEIMLDEGFGQIEKFKDLQGIDRVISGKYGCADDLPFDLLC